MVKNDWKYIMDDDIFKEERMEKVEAGFREIIKEDGLWHPIAFIDSFSNDFIREMRNRLWMNGPAVKLAIKNRGQKFYEEMYGKDSK